MGVNPVRWRRKSFLSGPPQQFENQRQPQRLSARFGKGAGQERPGLVLPFLHLARKTLEQAARLGGQGYQNRAWRLAFLQIDFTQPVERGDRPRYSLGLLRSEEHTSELQSLRHLVC